MQLTSKHLSLKKQSQKQRTSVFQLTKGNSLFFSSFMCLEFNIIGVSDNIHNQEEIKAVTYGLAQTGSFLGHKVVNLAVSSKNYYFK